MYATHLASRRNIQYGGIRGPIWLISLEVHYQQYQCEIEPSHPVEVQSSALFKRQQDHEIEFSGIWWEAGWI